MTVSDTSSQFLRVVFAHDFLGEIDGPTLVVVDARFEMHGGVASYLGLDAPVVLLEDEDEHNPLLVAATTAGLASESFGVGRWYIAGAGDLGDFGNEVLISAHGRVLCAAGEVNSQPVVLIGAKSISRSFEDAVAQYLGVEPRPVESVDAVVPQVRTDSFVLGVDPGESLEDEKFFTAFRRAGRILPGAIYDAVTKFADNPPAAGALLLSGLPIGELPDTPTNPRETADKSLRTELLLCAVARLLGQPVGYAPELSGKIVQDLVPTKNDRYRQVSTSSGSTLDWHTEAAFHPHRPRYLLLLCLRGDEEARTTLASIRVVLAHLEPHVVDTLRQPLFTTRADESYVGARPTKTSRPRGIISGPSGEEQFCFDADLMEGVNEEAEVALNSLLAAIREHHGSVCLVAGDLLIVDNNLAVHGRTPFTPRFDGKDRWLQRTFVVSDLSLSADDRSGRVIDTRFRA